jgi:hypothetical protein
MPLADGSAHTAEYKLHIGDKIPDFTVNLGGIDWTLNPILYGVIKGTLL